MKKMNSNSNRLDYLLFVIIAIYMEPPYVASSKAFLYIDKAYDLLKVAVMLFGALIYVRRINSVNSKLLFSFTAVWVAPLFVSIINHSNIKSGILSLITVVVPCVAFCDLFLKDRNIAIRTVSAFFNCLITINFATQLIYHDGIEYNYSLYGAINGIWFLGQSNSIIAFVLVAVVMNLIVYEFDRKKENIIFIVISCISILLADSATASVGVFLVLLIYAIVKSFFIPGGIKKMINSKILFSIAICITVIFLIIGNISIFSKIIVDVLKKDLTLTTRTIVWQKVIPAIAEKPICGYGFPYIDQFRNRFGVSHQHDFYLHIMYQGGICSLLPFLRNVIIAGRQLDSSDSNESKIIIAGIFAFLIMFISEVYDESLYILPFYLLLSIPLIDRYSKKMYTRKE